MTSVIAAKVIRAVCTALAVARDWEETVPKVFLWHIFMSLVSDVDHFRRYTKELGLLSYDIIFMKVTHGLALYTVKHMQVNVNVLVATCVNVGMALIREVVDYLACVHADYTINLCPLQTHVAELSVAEFVKRRRFVPSRPHIRELKLGDDGVELYTHREPLHSRIEQTRDVVKYKPLNTMCETDPLETIYWHRFGCGSIVAFRNPIVDLVEEVPFPHPLDCTLRSTMSLYMNESYCEFVDALQPRDIRRTLEVICHTWIPLSMRELCVCAAICAFGITDELLVAVGHNFDQPPRGRGYLTDMVQVFSMIQMSSKSSDVCMCEMLSSVLQTVGTDPTWTKWMGESELLSTCTHRIPHALLQSLCRRPQMGMLRTVLVRLLHHRLGRWTNEDEQVAAMLHAMSIDVPQAVQVECDVELARVLTAFAELMNVAAGIMTDMLSQPAASAAAPVVRAKRSKKKHNKTEQKLRSAPTRPARPGDGRVDTVAAGSWSSRATPTHVQLVQAMQAELQLDMELIGSGIFSAEGDADVVVTLPHEPTLSGAYERVVAATGWSPQYERVDGMRVAVLSGTYNGVSVDAQVWRGEDRVESRSESQTQNALTLTRRLLSETDDMSKDATRWLHRWATATNLKGHKLCRLPGVAVTCLAVVFTCRKSQRFDGGGGGGRDDDDGARAADGATHLNILSHIRDWLRVEMPVVDFDTLDTCESPIASRCIVPIAVIVNKANCCNRMTAATSRHMLDILTHAISSTLRFESCLHRGVYTRWRKQNMVVCVRVCPLTSSSVSYSLACVASSLEGHPTIDTLYFDEDDDSGHIAVLCTLRADADVHNYGFHIGDNVVVCLRHTICIERNRRVFALAISPRRATTKCATRVSDMLHFKGMNDDCSVPNMVTLTCDVSVHFDPRLWKIV